jgi:phosphatidylethanolamine/phosphatidyl-N-methylethanolamine N-methyltransferase
METQTLPTKSASDSVVYRQLARYYDWAFGPVYTRRILTCIRNLNIPAGADVLEIGVGTGISLAAYPPHAKVVGVDASRDMLDQAAKKIAAQGWKHIELRQMDALDLQFPDESFDFVNAFHVVSVVNDVHQAMREMVRVCKPNGRILIINHFRSPRPWLARTIDTLSPLTRYLGWRTNLSGSDLLRGLPLRIVRQFKTSPTSLFTVLEMAKNQGQS